MAAFLKIGTRGSPLALFQARLVQRLLPHEAEIIIFKTSGDKIKGNLKDFGGKGLFTKELEDALIEGRIDMAVHSMKDVPTLNQPPLMIGAILKREDPRDAFIATRYKGLKALPEGAVIGTASIRRTAQLLAIRPDVKFKLLRGNVGTRLEKVITGEFDATFLACAGLKRLGLSEVITEAVAPELMLPAPAQGAIGIEIRKDDDVTSEAITPLIHDDTHLTITAERAFLEALDGSCRTPIAALAEMKSSALKFQGEVIAKDGSLKVFRQKTLEAPTLESAYALGFRLGQEVRDEIGDRIIWDEV